MSNINPQNIDGTYPIAGQDNNSQGFRDNFTNTVNNFTFAAAELTDLQTYAVLKGPLGSVGQTGTPTNVMDYTYITEPQLLKAVETTKFIGNTSSGGSFEVDWSQGHFQTVGVTSTATMSFASTWPTINLHTQLRLQITTYGTTAITLPSEVSQNISSIRGVSANVLTLGPGVYQFEFTTADQGATIAIRDLWRNYDAAIDFTTLNVTGNLTAGLSSFAAINNTPIGNATPSTGAFSTLSATGTTTLSGNLVTGAAHVETGYQQIKPTANVAVTVNHNVNRVLIHPTGSIVSFGANVTLPNVQVNGTIVNISSNVTIASLDVRSGYNDVVAVSPFGNVTNITAGTNTRYMYIAADSTWYKIA
jgi:hypothetical protein